MPTFTLPVMVSGIPETVRLLRDKIDPGPGRKPPPVEWEGTNEIVNGTRGFGPRLPLDVDALDAADQLFATAAYWAEMAGIDVTHVGRTWRYPPTHPEAPGAIRGIRSGDLDPVYLVVDQLMNEIESPHWQEPAGMHGNLTGILSHLSKRWPLISAMLADRQRRNLR
ncbi:hypothetical protein [Rhodococcus sp. NPDC060176]|uniref:hypothetical protein n=1 Tax=Rhodococcus sp. NPDC060176 TaxID=3347062 RepID=UPI00365F2366